MKEKRPSLVGNKINKINMRFLNGGQAINANQFF